jgi:hypothetical protein
LITAVPAEIGEKQQPYRGNIEQTAKKYIKQHQRTSTDYPEEGFVIR